MIFFFWTFGMKRLFPAMLLYNLQLCVEWASSPQILVHPRRTRRPELHPYQLQRPHQKVDGSHPRADVGSLSSGRWQTVSVMDFYTATISSSKILWSTQHGVMLSIWHCITSRAMMKFYKRHVLTPTIACTCSFKLPYEQVVNTIHIKLSRLQPSSRENWGALIKTPTHSNGLMMSQWLIIEVSLSTSLCRGSSHIKRQVLFLMFRTPDRSANYVCRVVDMCFQLSLWQLSSGKLDEILVLLILSTIFICILNWE